MASKSDVQNNGLLDLPLCVFNSFVGCPVPFPTTFATLFIICNGNEEDDEFERPEVFRAAEISQLLML